MYITTVILASLLAFSSPLLGKELTWYTLPIVGLAELKDGKPADGAIFAIQKLIESELPRLEHRYLASAANRVIYEMSRGTPLCTTIASKFAERDHVGYFVPFLPLPPMHLIVRPETRDHLPLTNGAVSFEQLVKTDGLRGVITPARIYPADLTGFISQAKKNGKITSISSNSLGTNLLTMVGYRRFDYTLEYQVVISRINQSSNASGKLISIPIVEHTHLGSAGFYCTRNSWGKDIARQLDSAVRRLSINPERLMDIYRNTTDDVSIMRFEPQIRAYLKARADTETNF